MIEYLWLIPLIPLAGAALNGIAGKRLPKSVISLVACGAAGAAFLVALGAVRDLLLLSPDSRHITKFYFTWIASGDFVAKAEFLLDLRQHGDEG